MANVRSPIVFAPYCCRDCCRCFCRKSYLLLPSSQHALLVMVSSKVKPSGYLPTETMLFALIISITTLSLVRATPDIHSQEFPNEDLPFLAALQNIRNVKRYASPESQPSSHPILYSTSNVFHFTGVLFPKACQRTVIDATHSHHSTHKRHTE
ncbi:hypothetical protein EV356DRAFT_230639 [Viridothelium virens]|uniref:Uncharacterized protein n=1 Tax=Viridothelium virens TaxID=1048519 RepID=A0A6A6H4L1_VIRVR|nr:hypothetical protein EV356DRAFT_230639 [Viridothelium virens]